MAGPALVTLKNGYSYAATTCEVGRGWVRIEGARFWKTGPDNAQRTRFGRTGEFYWPREEVREVKSVPNGRDLRATT